MQAILRPITAALLLSLLAPGAGHELRADWVSVSWHDVRDDVNGHLDPDRFAVDVRHLAEQFDWLARNGWTPISLDHLLAAREGRRALPDKAVLLTFDDGLASMYTHVFPLLRAYGYPAVAAVVTGWLEQPADWSIDYEGSERGRDDFLTWAQLRTMLDSGLVEVASHSHDMHRGVAANPQGNTQPAATTRKYLPHLSRYETEGEWQRRIRDDLVTSADLIEAHTGRRPSAIVWPYGEYNTTTEVVARELGMVVSLGLTTGRNPAGHLHGLHRFLITANPDIGFFANALPQAPARRIHRVAHVDLDYVHDPDTLQQDRNLDALVERIHALNINTVYLQAFADPEGDGNAAALYFPNRHLPVRADLFNRVAWQLRTRAGVRVYAWMPVLAFDLTDRAQAQRLAVRRHTADGPQIAQPDYRRLSPFLPEAREIIHEIYADLAAQANFAGILFHDDAYLAADEDAAACLAEATWPDGQPIAECMLSPADKTRALIDFTHALTDTVRRWRPSVYTARNLYARPVLEAGAEARFSQSLPAFLNAYDHTALMAMPWLEEAANPDTWLDQLVQVVAAHPAGLERTVFQLQARDWAGDRWLDGEVLKQQMRRLVRQGALHLGYYPDDFIGGQPELEPLFQGLSGRTFPYRGHE